MPLLGKKIFHCVKQLTDVKSSDTIYTIPHTKEQFKSKDEYERRLALYKDRVWTCQCTGHIGLSHEEAWNSEKAVHRTLKSQVPECYEKPVLELVHHSTSVLDTLVDQAWLKLQQVLSVGEKVTLKVKNAGKTIKGAVVKVDSAGVEANPTSNCSSPSSDKENSGDSEISSSSPKKWVPPKLLPYKYAFHIDGEDKIINSVPAADLSRVDRSPSKDLLRLFIRAHAVRVGPSQTSPYVVDEASVKKYSIPNKYPEIFFSPIKASDMPKKVEGSLKRRLSSKSPDASAAKKQKKDKSNGKEDKKQTKLTSPSVRKKSPKKQPTPKKSSPHKKSPKKLSPKKSVELIEIDSDDESTDDEVVLSKLRDDACSSDDEVVLSNIKNKEKKRKASSDSSDSELDVVLADIQRTPTKKSPNKKLKSSKKEAGTPNKKKIKDKTQKKLHNSKKSSSLKKKNEKTPTKKGKSPTKEGKKKKDNKKSPGKKLAKKGMKQMTLFDMSKKKGFKTTVKGQKSPDKKRVSPQKMPEVVSKLVKAVKSDDKTKVNYLIQQAAKILSSPQRSKLPTEIKELVSKKYDQLQEQRKLKMMSPHVRQEYLKKKREALKLKMAAEKRAKLEESKKRFEDTELKLKPLPASKLVPTPDSVPNEMFGDIAMVTEFIGCYAGLLMPDDEYPIYTDALMKALANGKEGFAYMGRVLGVLLLTLLQDQIAEDYEELKVPLSDIPVNPSTASELVRLCLRKHDVSSDQNSDYSFNVEEEDEVPEDLLQMLESQELHQLDPMQKVQILKALCLRIMGTYSVQDYMEDKQKAAATLWREKIAVLKEKNLKEKAEKEKKKQEQKTTEGETTAPKENTTPKDNKTEGLEEEKKSTDKDTTDDKKGLQTQLMHFYGKASEKAESPETAPEESGSDSDLVSVIKNRRILSAKAAEDKRKREMEDKIKREKEMEIYKKQREKEIFEQKFNEGILLAKLVLRETPIGTDRNHSQYWIFKNTTPGLFVEKGWVNEDINYRFKLTKKKSDTTEDSDSEDSDTSQPLKKTSKPASMETTLPHCGQNLWFTIDSVKDLDMLIENLTPQGFRESALKAELKKRYTEITKAIILAKRTNLELRDSDGDKDLIEGIKKEVLDTELRLRNGGLGGVNELETFETKLKTAEDISEIGERIIEMENHVMDKFRQGILGPPKKKAKPSDVKVEPEDEKEEEEKEEEEEKIREGRVKWREAVGNCTTFSRLHVLLGMFDSCIKWEKSAENAKCKICRKKGDDDQLLLCDECNQAYHLWCLRPALAYIPQGEWYCPSCMPQKRRNRSVPERYMDIEEPRSRRSKNAGPQYAESSEESEEEIVHEENCQECGGDEGLIYCEKCPSAYHLECHDPPLRHPPRGHWQCSDCKNGGPRSSRSRSKTQRGARQQNRVSAKRKYEESDSSSEEDDESSEKEDSEDSETEEDSTSEPAAKSARRTLQQTSRNRAKPPVTKSRTKTSHTSNKSATKVDDSFDFKPTSRRAPSELSICGDILSELIKLKCCWPFLSPVNKREVPDYYSIIKHPMDLQTVKDKLNCLNYGSAEEVIEDVALVFRNAGHYNQADSEVFTCMEESEKSFMELLGKNLPFYHYSREPKANGYADQNSTQGRHSRR